MHKSFPLRPLCVLFELDVADLVMKHIDKLKSSGALHIEDHAEAAKKIREELFGKYTKEQLDAAAIAKF